MNAVEILALVKAVVWVAPLLLLVRELQWRWLSLAVVVFIVGNMSTVAGASRPTTLYISLISQALLIAHVVDLSKYRRGA